MFVKDIFTRFEKFCRLAGNAGPLVDFLLKVLQCCLWCFEKFMKFINKNAYIMCGKISYVVIDPRPRIRLISYI